MRPTVTELHTSGHYTLVESFGIDEMNQFVMRELGARPRPERAVVRTGPKRWAGLLVLVVVGGIAGYGVGQLIAKNDGVDSFLIQMGAGVLALFLLLPVHEFIHGLAFRGVGAPSIGYGYSLKSMMVYVFEEKGVL
jgi:hypothetical protein